MHTAALIRTHKFGADEAALKSALQAYFGDHIFFIFENFHDKDDRIFPDEAGRSFVMTSDFLDRYGLSRFPKAGWQCGDYSYYAGATRFSGYDFYWLVEPDVKFTFADAGDFFGKFETSATQFLGFDFGLKTAKWHWYDSMNNMMEGEVYGVPFPLTRMGRPAALHLLDRRSQYCRSRWSGAKPADFRNNKAFANDESFTASILARDGFSCGKLEDIAGKQTISHATFSTNVPIMPAEISAPGNRNKVFHPVCAPEAAHKKLTWLLRAKPLQFKRKMDGIIAGYGVAAWEAWSGITVEAARAAL